MVGSAIRDGIDLIEMFLSSEAASFVGGASGGSSSCICRVSLLIILVGDLNVLV